MAKKRSSLDVIPFYQEARRKWLAGLYNYYSSLTTETLRELLDNPLHPELSERANEYRTAVMLNILKERDNA